jgi:hypothetical protein
METPIDWQREARKMRAQGKSSDEIAALVGQTVPAVREVLRGTRRTRLAVLGAGRAEIPEPHVARTPRVVLDRQAVPFAAAEFAAGTDRPGGAHAANHALKSPQKQGFPLFLTLGGHHCPIFL